MLFYTTGLLVVQLRSRTKGLFQKLLVPLGAMHFIYGLDLQLFVAVAGIRN